MNWHAAQIGFVIATLILVAATAFVGVYVISTLTWSDRWAVRRRHLPR